MFKTFAEMLELLKPFKKVFVILLAMQLIYEAMQVLESYSTTAALRLLEGKGLSVALFFVLGLLIFFDQPFRMLDHQLDWHIVSRLFYPVFKHLKMSVLKKFLTQDSSWHQQNNSGVLIGKTENGIHKAEDLIDMASWDLIPTSMQAILTLIPLVYWTPLIALVILGSLIIFLCLSIKAESFRLKPRKERYNRYEELWQSMEEAVKAFETLSIYGQVKRIIQEHEQKNDDIIALGMREARKTIFFYHALRNGLLQITNRAILVILLLQLHRHSIAMVDIFFVKDLSARLINSFWRIARMMQKVGECSEGISRLNALSKQEPGIIDGPHTLHNLSIPENLVVEFKNVTFSYPGSTKKAMENLDLIIQGGQEVAIVGPSGSGKTTFRRILLRLFEINKGEILIGGIPIKHWPLEKLRSLFAFVPQGDEVFIFDSTIGENIIFSRPGATEHEVRQAAKQAGIEEFITGLPEGYRTRVGEKGIKLSGGQKQRIALARAILSRRKFLILDEATSSVDALTEQEIQYELKKILKGVTSIVIAHRIPTIWDANNIVVMHNGIKVAEGKHADHMLDPNGLYYQMVRLQTSHHM